MSGLKGWVISLCMIALFSVTLITFAMNFATDNKAINNIKNDSDFVSIKSEYIENISQIYRDINTSSDAMYKSTISSQTEATEGGTSFKVGPATALSMAITSMSAGFKKIFGSGTEFVILLTALTAILTFITIMYIYKAWAGRDPGE